MKVNLPEVLFVQCAQFYHDVVKVEAEDTDLDFKFLKLSHYFDMCSFGVT